MVAAQVARLRYVSDRIAGITRLRAGNGFVFRGPDGGALRDPDELLRIKLLRIPPAWTRVWICPDPDGHLQAVGYDARGRKQYLYHPRWREVRDETKFEHMLTFGRALPRMRRRVEADLRLRGLPRDKVLAAVVRLMERTLGRIGNPEYAKQNKTFGLTTLRRNHVRITREGVELDFRGKHGIRHHRVIGDPILARILKSCHELPGAEVFKYLGEDGERHHISSQHVNDYLREISGHHITAKDFRTWAATNLAALEMVSLHETKPTRRGVVAAVKRVAAQLGNTPAVCRKSYIHPRVLASYLDGSLRPPIKMMRLLTQWHADGSSATEAADKAVRMALRNNTARTGGHASCSK
jgi:DNA topoisomerase-1